MNLLVASNNEHKIAELKEILKTHRLFSPKDLGIELEVEETEKTFLGNALLKARALWEASGGKYAVLSDDSGLVVPALDRRPGIYSARFGSDIYGRMLTSTERNEYLLSLLEKESRPKAFFVCSMVLCISQERFFTAQETLEGQIVASPSGSGGFGYDPIFYLPEHRKTVAELPDGLKQTISHRAKAAMAIDAILSHLAHHKENSK